MGEISNVKSSCAVAGIHTVGVAENEQGLYQDNFLDSYSQCHIWSRVAIDTDATEDAAVMLSILSLVLVSMLLLPSSDVFMDH